LAGSIFGRPRADVFGAVAKMCAQLLKGAPMLEDKPVPEATLSQTPHGLVPEGSGWFIVNVADAAGMRSDRFGQACRFEGESRFPQFGINVRVLEPGQPNCLYHRETAQEAFFVLSGDCIAIVEGQDRAMKAGDLLYAPPRTAHVLVGAGDGPCSILMVGTRDPAEELLYPVNEVAGRHGASVEHATPDENEAYAGTKAPEPAKLTLPGGPGQ
jgi:uncharacterized cupin superfamily protein